MHGDVYGSQCVDRVAAPAAPDGRAVEIVRRLDWACWDTIGAIILRCQMSRGGEPKKKRTWDVHVNIHVRVGVDGDKRCKTVVAGRSYREGYCTEQARSRIAGPRLLRPVLAPYWRPHVRQYVSIQKTAQLH